VRASNFMTSACERVFSASAGKVVLARSLEDVVHVHPRPGVPAHDRAAVLVVRDGFFVGADRLRDAHYLRLVIPDDWSERGHRSACVDARKVVERLRGDLAEVVARRRMAVAPMRWATFSATILMKCRKTTGSLIRAKVAGRDFGSR